MTARSLSARTIRALVRRWQSRLSLAEDPWKTLATELDRWPRGQARFWWRDDDAHENSPQLQRLLTLRAEHGVPLALAVIPARLDPALASTIRAEGNVFILGHGWDHRDHAPAGTAAIELGAGRNRACMFAQLATSHDILSSAFGSQFHPVLVPPFNRIDPLLAQSLDRTGYREISIDGDFTFLPGNRLNVHVDVNDWHTGTAATAARVIRELTGALRLRRWRLVPRSQPIGLLTHHLVHDEASWILIGDLLRRLSDHPAVCFPPLPEIFSSAR